jgi:glycosyltransferase involved in cell wall biosynthesis
VRVLFWSDPFWPTIGGTEVISLRLIEALRVRGHEFLVIASNAGLELPAEESYNGIPIRRFPFWTALAAKAPDQLLEVRREVGRLRREFQPDLVHVAFIAPGVIFQLQTAHIHPAPLLVTMQQHISPFQNRGAAGLLTSVLRAADWIVACSEATRGDVETMAPEVASRCSVIRNALEPAALAPSRLPASPPRVLCLGRLAPQKGFDLALPAYASIARRFPGVRLEIAGDGPQRSELEALAASLGIRDRVDFLGWVAPQAVPGLINRATVVVMPSREDPFPLVAIEAALMGRPLIATRVGGLREAVVDGETGLLVDPDDATAIAQALAHLLENLDVAQRLGDSARTWALATYSWEGQVRAYEAVYRKLCEEAVHVGA